MSWPRLFGMPAGSIVVSRYFLHTNGNQKPSVSFIDKERGSELTGSRADSDKYPPFRESL
jgi:hypothetical protein